MFCQVLPGFTRAHCYKTFFARNLQIYVKASVFCPWQTVSATSNKLSSSV
jgi:hypothetical protein